MSARDWPVDVDPMYGCWIWTGGLDRDGYGRVRATRRLAHRIVYTAERGQIGALQLDHTCRRRSCVCPWHLEAVTPSVNLRRRNLAWCHRNIRRCQYGHDLYGALLTEFGGRVCRTCKEVYDG